MAAPLRFGRYEALFKIASGGMAEVFAARIRGEAGFEKLVAVKRMLPHLADDHDFVSMFLDEARVAATIGSPHVVQTLDLGRADDGALYIVMELVVGVTLSDLVGHERNRMQPLPVALAAEIVAQAAQGLDDAHEATTPVGEHLEIVHRDVSPQNVLIGIDGRVRVADFGIARALFRQTQSETGRVKGKCAYFSPEQAVGKPLDRRSDVFSLGAVAWEALAGSWLFRDESPRAMMDRVRGMRIPRLNELRREVPPGIAAVIAKALERERTERWPTGRDFAAALRAEIAHFAGGPIATREIGKFVVDARVPRLAELQERIRSAVHTPPGQTLPDIGTPGGVADGTTRIVEGTPEVGAGELDPTRVVLSPQQPVIALEDAETDPPMKAPELPETRLIAAPEVVRAVRVRRGPPIGAVVVGAAVVVLGVLVAVWIGGAEEDRGITVEVAEPLPVSVPGGGSGGSVARVGSATLPSPTTSPSTTTTTATTTTTDTDTDTATATATATDTATDTDTATATATATDTATDRRHRRHRRARRNPTPATPDRPDTPHGPLLGLDDWDRGAPR